MANKNLQHAKAAKNDEFYTRIEDIANELRHYKKHFRDAVVFCNCDDPTWSAFWRYFHLNFGFFGMKKLIATHYDKENPTYKLEYEGGDDNDVSVGIRTDLEGNGDFRNQECLELMDEADIIVTNPPFSMFREYMATLMEHGKKFVIIGNKNCITYKEIFPLLKEDRIWMGYSSPSDFDTPDGMTKKMNGLCRWFTNLDIDKRHERLILWKKYSPEEFPKYDNYDAINVDKVASIPIDYCESWEVTADELAKLPEGQWEVARESERDGKRTAFIIPAEGTELRRVLHEHQEGYREEIEGALAKELVNAGYCPGAMGVPITFLDKHNPEEFELVQFRHGDDGKDLTYTKLNTGEASKTDRQTDRQTDAVLPDCHQKDTVMESWACPSPSPTNTTRNISESSETKNPLISNEGGDMSTESAYTDGFSSKRYCNGVMGAPITFLDKHNPEEFSIEEPPRKECASASALTESSKNSQSVKVERESCEQKFEQFSLQGQTDGTSTGRGSMRGCSSGRFCNGTMGVPVTFLDKFNPDQYALIGHEHDLEGCGGAGIAGGQFELSGKGMYKRLLVRKIL